MLPEAIVRMITAALELSLEIVRGQPEEFRRKHWERVDRFLTWCERAFPWGQEKDGQTKP